MHRTLRCLPAIKQKINRLLRDPVIIACNNQLILVLKVMENDREIMRITSRLDIIASELEKKRPDLALALDFISDRLEKRATVPTGLKSLYKQYQEAGGASSLDHFLGEDIPGFMKFLGKDGAAIWEWDKTKGPASKK